jgi:conjugal transfer pilus assembly protein TraE
MQSLKHTQQLSEVIKQRNIACAGLLAASLVIIMLSIAVLFKSRIVVVTPSVIAKQYEISSTKVSKSYLEDMTRDIITTMLNLTPKNVAYSSDAILQMVHPSAYGEVKKELFEIQKDVIDRKVSTVFYPLEISVSEDKLMTQVTGDFSTFVGNSLTSTKRKTFQIAFNYTGAKLTIGGFSEIVVTEQK